MKYKWDLKGEHELLELHSFKFPGPFLRQRIGKPLTSFLMNHAEKNSV